MLALHIDIDYFSEDLTREQKAQRRAEQESAEVDEWEKTPIEMRAAPGYQPYPGSSDGYYEQGHHSNKMRGAGRGGRGGLLDAARGRAGLGKPYPIPGKKRQERK